MDYLKEQFFFKKNFVFTLKKNSGKIVIYVRELSENDTQFRTDSNAATPKIADKWKHRGFFKN